MQPKFANPVPNALDPGFIYDTTKGSIKVGVGQTVQYTGLVAPDGATAVPTTLWGYGADGFVTWPGRTFQVRSYEPLEVKWENRLKRLPYLLTGKNNTNLGFGDYTGRSVVDTNLHWAYSLHGYEDYTIEKNGVPINASEPINEVIQVMGMYLRKPPIWRISCTWCMAMITEPAPRNSSALKKAWVMRWKILAAYAEAPSATVI